MFYLDLFKIKIVTFISSSDHKNRSGSERYEK